MSGCRCYRVLPLETISLVASDKQVIARDLDIDEAVRVVAG